MRGKAQQSKAKRLTQPSPLAQLFPIGHVDKRNRVLRAQRHHELLVGLLLARLVEHAHVRLSSVERLGGFAEPAGEAVVDECELQGAFEGVEDGLLAGLGILVWRSAYRADFGVGDCHIWQ